MKTSENASEGAVGFMPRHFLNMLLNFSLADTSSAATPISLAECPASGTTCNYREEMPD